MRLKVEDVEVLEQRISGAAKSPSNLIPLFSDSLGRPVFFSAGMQIRY